ncbi:hypothetical protein YC2023_025467 [Brassica napus]
MTSSTTLVDVIFHQRKKDIAQIWVPSNPKGAETLPPGIITSESDLYLRRFWGNPEEKVMNLRDGRMEELNIEECLNNFKEGLSLGLRMTLRLYREDREEEEGLLDRDDDELEGSETIRKIMVGEIGMIWAIADF